MAFTKEQKRKHFKNYYQKHKQHYINASRKWKQAHPEIFKYYMYISGAKKRNLAFELSKTEFIEIISQPCFYCGELQENFNGIDRVNNAKGYIKNNCVPCCKVCNRMKHIFLEDMFVKKCREIVIKQELKL